MCLIKYLCIFVVMSPVLSEAGLVNRELTFFYVINYKILNILHRSYLS